MARKRRKKTWLMWWLLGALATAAIGAGVSYYNMGQQEKFNDQNIDLAKWQNQQNIEQQWQMWNATNEYNKPVNQMKRYEEAGLNPNLIYGQTNTANPITLPSQTTPQGSSAPQYDARWLLEQLQKLPFFKQQLESVELDNQAKRLQNIILANEGDIRGNQAELSTLDMYKFRYLMGYDDPEKGQPRLDSYLSNWFENQIADTENKQEKTRLMVAQREFQAQSARLKELEYQFNNGQLGDQGYYEMKLEAMRIANALQLINLDWAEAEKAITAGSKFGSSIWSMVKTFMK